MVTASSVPRDDENPSARGEAGMRATTVIAAVAAPALAVGAAAATAQVAAAWPNGGNGDYYGSGINIRQGPHLSSPSNGLGYAGQGIHAACYKAGDYVTGHGVTSNIWILHTNAATGVGGDSALPYMFFDPIPAC
jgi:hypothetical protein